MIFQPPQNSANFFNKFMQKSFSKTGKLSQVKTSRQRIFKTKTDWRIQTHRNLSPQPLFKREARSQSKKKYIQTVKFSQRKSPQSKLLIQGQSQLRSQTIKQEKISAKQSISQKLTKLLSIENKSKSNKYSYYSCLSRYNTSRGPQNNVFTDEKIHISGCSAIPQKDAYSAISQKDEQGLTSTNISLSIQGLRKSQNKTYMRVSKRSKSLFSNSQIKISSSLLFCSKKQKIIKTNENQEEQDQKQINIRISERSFTLSQNQQIQNGRQVQQVIEKQMKSFSKKRYDYCIKQSLKFRMAKHLIRIQKNKVSKLALLNHPSITIKSLRKNFICQ